MPDLELIADNKPTRIDMFPKVVESQPVDPMAVVSMEERVETNGVVKEQIYIDPKTDFKYSKRNLAERLSNLTAKAGIDPGPEPDKPIKPETPVRTTEDAETWAKIIDTHAKNIDAYHEQEEICATWQRQTEDKIRFTTHLADMQKIWDDTPFHT